MSYWNSFTNLYTRAISSFRPVVRYTPQVYTAPLFNYTSSYVPNFSTNYFPKLPMPCFNFKMPSFNFNLSSTWKGIKNTTQKVTRWGSNLGSNIVTAAKKYLGYNEANGSYKLFTNGRTEAWCADFSTYVTKEAFKASGKAVPKGFGSASVEGLRQWGIKNNCYLKTAGLSNKTGLIKNNVKPGDLIVFKEQGRSHVGVVESIGADGKIHTIEGNTSDKVARRSYAANNSTISGFVQMA